MIVVNCPEPSSHDTSRIVMLFGVGLVGSAVLHALVSRGEATVRQWPLSWQSTDQRADDLANLSKEIASIYEGPKRLVRIDTVWAAGKAGFASSQSELDSELGAFNQVLGWASNLRAIAPKALLRFHMLSSGGGLFEGQRFVDRTSIPEPQRPYGRVKLEQERLLELAREDMGVYIYRPSSIYGFTDLRSGRLNLVNALINNAKTHTVTRIFGGLDTLRDYVLSSDVGEFIARRILSDESEPGVFTLASGKPTSIKEMLKIAEEIVGRPLYLKLDSSPSNAGHITYRTTVLPADWSPTDLETGMRLVARQLSLSFSAGTRREGSNRLAMR